MTEKKKYGVLGSGSWATALSKILVNNHHSINWYVRDLKNIQLFELHKHNPHYLSSVRFDMSKIEFYSSAEEVIKNSDIIIIAIPSAYVVSVLDQLPSNAFQGKKIISAIKGIIPPQNILLNEYLLSKFNISVSQYSIVAGPCHAEEVASEKLSYLTFASNQKEHANIYANDFANDYIKTVENPDIFGVQYAAVLKNIYAVGAGIAHGLDYGDNFMSVLIAASANEMVGFLRGLTKEAANDEKINYAASVYLGDLLVTCYSLHSRNRRFGNYLGKGYSVKAAQLEMNMVAEGYNASKGIFEKNKTLQLNIPIAETIYRILWEDCNPAEGFENIEKILI
jgi:glycerol-3-phosphate dehydrogenase (NAD(P)+)